jgi:hypothetical protein
MSLAIPAQETAFESDVCAYLDALPKLLNTAEGQFALVGSASVAAVFATREEAMSAGYSRFGDRGFLVQQVSERDLEMASHWHRPC